MQSRDRDTLTTWAEETGSDRRNVRWAIIVALAIHALFFRLQLPESVAAEVRPPGRVVCELAFPPRFQPPPPREQLLLPRERARRVPVPDPTPDDPEPLAPPDRLQVPVARADGDIVWDLPAAPAPGPPSGPLTVGGEVLPPVKVHAPPPRYPEIARKARIQGEVHLEAVIDATGGVGRIRVIRGLPMGLDRAAVDAVSQWRFEPATYRGRPVAVIYNLTIIFTLR